MSDTDRFTTPPPAGKVLGVSKSADADDSGMIFFTAITNVDHADPNSRSAYSVTAFELPTSRTARDATDASENDAEMSERLRVFTRSIR